MGGTHFQRHFFSNFIRTIHHDVGLLPVLDGFELHFLLLLFLLLLPHVVPVDADGGKVGLFFLWELQAESLVPVAVLVVDRVQTLND